MRGAKAPGPLALIISAGYSEELRSRKAGGRGAYPGDGGYWPGAAVPEDASVFSGTSTLSPSHSQRSGKGLASEQSTTHSRFCPLVVSRRVTLTCPRSE